MTVGLKERFDAIRKGLPVGGKEQWVLKDLLKHCDIVQLRGDKHVCIHALATDSRRVTPGSLFFALSGERNDGNFFLEDAIARGAVAIVSERKLRSFLQVPCVQVEDARMALAQIARHFYNNPDEHLEMIGVTGTNGKSTVGLLTQFLLQNEPHKVGLLGTIVYDLGGRTLPASRTTPDTLELYSMLEQMRQSGCKQAVMEVTSHGIDQRRVYGVGLEVGVFLNLTQDHIDYHGTMENYFEAKASMFTGALGAVPKKAIINIDDDYGRRLIGMLPKDMQVVTFGLNEKADVRVRDSVLGPEGSKFEVVCNHERFSVNTPLVGKYNISNIAASLAIVHALGYDMNTMASKVGLFREIPGRLEKVELGQPYTVIVDYAHTDDALHNVLGALREVTKGKLLVVFGCGGDRDKIKRPKMVGAVQKYADYAWATADNPRKESMESIFSDMREGILFPEKIVFEPDRRKAISLALDHAGEMDCVVIAGKGHETFQEFEDTVIPFDDRLVAKELITLKKLKEMNYY